MARHAFLFRLKLINPVKTRPLSFYPAVQANSKLICPYESDARNSPISRIFVPMKLAVETLETALSFAVKHKISTFVDIFPDSLQNYRGNYVRFVHLTTTKITVADRNRTSNFQNQNQTKFLVVVAEGVNKNIKYCTDVLFDLQKRMTKQCKVSF